MEATQINNFNRHKISEAEIIRRIISGEKELYEILVRRNNQKLYRVIRSYFNDEAEIEDIMQNSYIKGFTKLYQFKFQASFSTWLIRIAINEALVRLKEKGKLYHIDEQDEQLNKNSILEIPDNKQLNPQQKMIQHEAKQLIENAIDQLKPKYKIVYMMKEVEGMSLNETASALDLTLANVKIRLHRSKDMLKNKLFEISKDQQIFEFGFGRCDRITECVMSRI
ncbi:RNA polymerase sigma factor [Gelidibacter maritimus]|uniref:RNA polymerase sigma factor n=1 Tax=Gelidibacter maritimus TaxID=2761487 RepID=A0A7W2M866_9FLAO|nr:RNA polymerase sigma factor [Gelidibacter maritimus]MBA6154522.1 RNA polymerase sigma factor [Gelidibacter maritimus]